LKLEKHVKCAGYLKKKLEWNHSKVFVSDRTNIVLQRGPI